MPVLITGVGSSGTSMVAKIAYALGVNMGDLSELKPGDKINPYGYYERVWLNRMNLGLLGGQITLEHFLPHILQHTSYFREPWGFKDPRIADLADLYREIFPSARWIWVKRTRAANIASLRKHWNFSRGQAEDVYKKRTALLKEFLPPSKRQSLIVRHEDVLADPRAATKRIAAFLELPFSEGAVKVVRKKE